MKLFGEPLSVATPAQAIARGIALVTEDRKLSGLISQRQRAAQISAWRVCGRSARTSSSMGREKRNASREAIERFHIRVGRDVDPVSSLSGGNQQKVVLGKWFLCNPRVLLLDEPTRGVDVGAKREISRIVGDFRRGRRHSCDDLFGNRRTPRRRRPHHGHARRPVGRDPGPVASDRRKTRSPLSLDDASRKSSASRVGTTCRHQRSAGRRPPRR